jgi:hypothetical protein
VSANEQETEEINMRTLVATEYATLDGVVEALEKRSVSR